jgi:hypothetical protein
MKNSNLKKLKIDYIILTYPPKGNKNLSIQLNSNSKKSIKSDANLLPIKVSFLNKGKIYSIKTQKLHICKPQKSKAKDIKLQNLKKTSYLKNRILQKQ